MGHHRSDQRIPPFADQSKPNPHRGQRLGGVFRRRGRIGSLGLDVYEEEDKLFFENLSGQVVQDDVFARLLTFPNVLITGHQAFFTKEALQQIAATTLQNLNDILQQGSCKNQLHAS